MERIIREVLGAIGNDGSAEGDKPLPLEEAQEPVPLSKDNFCEIPDGDWSERISFVDGGNAEIFGAASFSLQLVRAAYASYENREKVERGRDDFYLLVKFRDDNFEVQSFPEGKLPDLEFDSLDPELTAKNERATARKIGGVCRRLFELKTALELEDSDFVVLDGDLYSRTAPEEEFLQDLREADLTVSGLSKTSDVMTVDGRVVAAALSILEDGEWLYRPVFRGGGVDVSFVRLQERSGHVFRLDTFDGPSDSLLSLLKGLSGDPVFPGYPYGLIEADKYARISNREAERARTRFATQFGEDWRDVKTYLHTRNAHDILDSIG